MEHAEHFEVSSAVPACRHEVGLTVVAGSVAVACGLSYRGGENGFSRAHFEGSRSSLYIIKYAAALKMILII